MRRLEHLALAVLLAAVAVLSWRQFRPVTSAAPEEASVAARPAPGPPRAAAAPEPDAPEPPPREETDAERAAREVQVNRRALAAAEEGAQLDALLDRAKQLLSADGLDALFAAEFPRQSGHGNDDDLRRLVAEFAKETDPARLWALAQRIRFHLTDPRGRIWTVDQLAYAAFETWAKEGDDAVKRGVALGAAGATGWGDEDELLRDRLLHDPDVRVRATAAGLLRPPKGVNAADAAPVADRFRELLGSSDPAIRAQAARGFGPWAFREADVEALVSAAQRDSSDGVRTAAARSLAACRSDRARTALAGLAADPAQPQAVRDAAAEGLRQGGVIEEVRVIRADTK
jgi:hypothetical protein